MKSKSNLILRCIVLLVSFGLASCGPGSRAEAGEYKAALPLWGNDFNPRCQGFIEEDGSLGAWGDEFLEAMYDVEDEYGKEIFFGSGESLIKLGEGCKSTEHFESLSRSEQEHVWVWIWASIAQAESSCDQEAQAQGIWNEHFQRYNIADGLLQLEYRTETRNHSKRDKVFCPDRTDSQAISFQARCSASIMAIKHSGEFLHYEGSYWKKLISSSESDIFKRIKKHPLCQ